MADSPGSGAFPRFPDLPSELRIKIWNECLPHRVYELDEDEFYKRREEPGLPYGLPLICGNRMTTEMNLRPPTISRVCRESRNIALESRFTIFPYEKMAEETYWESDTMSFGLIDLSRYTVHLNWLYWDVMIECEGNPVEYLAWHATNSAQGGSLMINNLACYDLRLLESIPNLMVVLKKIVIHGGFEYGLRSGLFGLLGDAPIQLVDILDQKRLDKFFALAEEAQEKGHVINAQDLSQRSCQELQEEFTFEIDRRLTKKLRTPEDKLPPMRGAIMFRLCTDMCNNSEEAEEGFQPSPGTTRLPRYYTMGGQGRGRAGREAMAAALTEFLESQRTSKTPFRLRGRLKNRVIA